jgi:hypothetical protein
VLIASGRRRLRRAHRAQHEPRAVHVPVARAEVDRRATPRQRGRLARHARPQHVRPVEAVRPATPPSTPCCPSPQIPPQRLRPQGRYASAESQLHLLCAPSRTSRALVRALARQREIEARPSDGTTKRPRAGGHLAGGGAHSAAMTPAQSNATGEPNPSSHSGGNRNRRPTRPVSVGSPALSPKCGGAGDRRRIALPRSIDLPVSTPAAEPRFEDLFEDFDPASEVVNLVERVEAAEVPVDGAADQHGLGDAFARCPCGDLLQRSRWKSPGFQRHRHPVKLTRDHRTRMRLSKKLNAMYLHGVQTRPY